MSRSKRWASFALLAFACAEKTNSAAPTVSASGTSSTGAPIPAELRAQLDAGAGCKWSESGLMQSCPASDALKKYVDAHKTPATLDGCLTAISDASPPIRVMASSCLYQYYFSTNTLEAKPTAGKLFDVVLAAIDKESVPNVRAALATAIWQRDAASVGKTDAVVATVRKLQASKDGPAMAFILASLHSYQMSEELPTNVAELATVYATAVHPEVRKQAYGMLVHARSRAQSTCSIFARAVSTDKEAWSDALSAFTRLGKPCEKEVVRVNEALVQRLERAADPKGTPADEIDTWGELRGYVASEIVPTAEREAIAKAADKIARGAKTSKSDQDIARTLASEARKKKAAR
jgi:hypothetical protein